MGLAYQLKELKRKTTQNSYQLQSTGLYSGGASAVERIFASEVRGAYFLEGLFIGGLIIGVLSYVYFQ